ncbi:MAG: cation:proton antiporter subunit C [Fretibacterium sp.]|nr:cation:proton antiporter subunit C [Fretibacterium sp.]
MGRLILNHYEAVAVILTGIGLTTLLLHRNLIKKILGLNIMDTAGFLFLAAKGYVAGRAAPILVPGADGGWVEQAGTYVNPIPAGLVLTGIVVSVSMTAFALALTLRFYKHYGTLNIDEALVLIKDAEQEAEKDEPLLVDGGDDETEPEPETLTARELLKREGLL